MEFLDFSSEEQCCEYEQFVQHHALGSFTQSLAWCGVKSGWGHEAVIVRDAGGKIAGTMLILVRRMPVVGSTFLYSPRGPVCDFHDRAVLSELMQGAALLAHRRHSFLFKCDPYLLVSDDEEIRNMQEMGFALKPDPDETAIQCRCNYMLEIAGKTQDEVFQSFRPKWRYNIRLAERKGVVCRYYEKDTLGEKMNEFYPLMQETGTRDGFNVRSKEYFVSMLDHLGSHCRLYLCEYEGHPISGAVAVQYAGKTCYVYGASSAACRSVMPNYLMQWNMIRWAIENGDRIYDFQGIPHYKDETHPNYGVYRFKKGFNGKAVEFAGEFNSVYSRVGTKAARGLYHIYQHSIISKMQPAVGQKRAMISF